MSIDTSDTPIAEIDPHLRFLQSTLEGNLSVLNPQLPAGGNIILVERYFELMQESPIRKLYTSEYVARCVQLVGEIPGAIEHKALLISAMLFHVVGYVPHDKKSSRRSRELALTFCSHEMFLRPTILHMIRFIKAAQAQAFLGRRYGGVEDYAADIAGHIYGLPWEEFEKKWALLLQEFHGAGLSPSVYKRFTRLHFQKLLAYTDRYDFYRTKFFEEKFGAQALENVKRKVEMLS